MNDGLLFDGSSIAGLASINDSDLLAKPDIDTFSTFPWRPEVKVQADSYVIFSQQKETHMTEIQEECLKNL